MKKISIKLAVISLFCSLVIPGVGSALTLPPVTNPQSGSVGLIGSIPSTPPTTAATIGSPSNGQVFTSQPITVSGICPNGLIIKIFDNGVFVGSAQCVNSTFSVTVTLFNGTNVLVAHDYDALGQEGPVSNTVTVTFNNPGGSLAPSLTLTSSYAELGASPGQSLVWPIIINGGTAPYAISVDWGDNQNPELVSQAASGTFNISHTYSESGVYKVIVKATDTSGDVAYLQLVGIANGPITQSPGSSGSSNNSSKPKSSKLSSATIIILVAVFVIGIITTFWLGQKHQLQKIKNKLEKGERPF